jgi:hypothetical protein
MNKPEDADNCFDVSNCSPALVQEVVSILRDRGIEATPQQVIEWAELMVKRKKEMRGKHTDARQWLAGVKHEMQVPTMCLHLHFGDAR